MLKNRRVKNIAILSLSIIFVVVIGLYFIGKATNFAFAAGNDFFEGYTCSGDLYTETNTFTYDGSTGTYNISEEGKTNASVSEKPLITVLTHGLNCSAGIWSNDGTDFAPDSTSLISMLNNKYFSETGQNANIYWAKMSGYNSFDLYDITKIIKTGLDNH